MSASPDSTYTYMQPYFKSCILYLQDSSDDYHGVVGRFRGHSEAADEELAEYFIVRVSRSHIDFLTFAYLC